MNSNQQQIFQLFQLYNSQIQNLEFEAIEQCIINQEQFLDCIDYFQKFKKFNQNGYFQKSIVYSLQNSPLRILQFGEKISIPIDKLSSLSNFFQTNDLQNQFILQEKSTVSKSVFNHEHNIKFNLKKESDIDQFFSFPKKYKNQIHKTRFRYRFTFFLNKHLKIDLTQIIDNTNLKYEIEYEFINDTSISVSVFNKLYQSIIDFHKKFFLIFYKVSTYVSNSEKEFVLSEYKRLFQSFFPYKSSDLQFIGPKSITLEKQNLIQFYNTPCILNDYTVTEKADGFRHSIFINSQGKVYLIDMQFNVKNTNIQLPKQKNSIIDCELIFRPRIHIIAIFDIYFHNNTLVSNLPLFTTKSNVDRSRLDLVQQVLSDLQQFNQSKIPKYSFNKKTFLTLNKNNIGQVIKKIYKKKYNYKIDGLIFTPNFLPVGANIYDPHTSKLTGSWNYQFKWKIDSENTADFYVQSKILGQEISRTKIQKSDTQSAKPGTPQVFPGPGLVPHSYELQLFVKGSFSLFENEGYPLDIQLQTHPKLIPNPYNIHYYDSVLSNKYINDEVWEFYFKDNQWYPLKKRQDKTNIFKTNQLQAVNDVQVVQQIKKTSQYPVTFQDFVSYDTQVVPSDIINYLISNSQLYYSPTVHRNLFKIKYMNNFHSQFIKLPLYQKAFLNSNVKNIFIKRSIVELAIGKAGDIHKVKAAGFQKLLGFDIFPDNIQNLKDGAIARTIELNQHHLDIGRKSKPLSFLYLVADISLDLFLQKSYSNKESLQIFKSKSRPQSNNLSLSHFIDKHIFGTISCQFAIHYMFKDELSLDTFIHNLDNFLAPGGTFIGTTFDKQYIIDLFFSNNSDSVKRFRDGVLLWQIDALYPKTSPSNWSPVQIFNNQLRVYVESINIPTIEYLFDFNILQEKLQKKNIFLISKSRFSEYPQFNYLSPPDKLYSNLNISFIFQKQLPG